MVVLSHQLQLMTKELLFCKHRKMELNYFFACFV